MDAPEILDRLYRETIDAFNNSSFLFCAGGLRALVEGICADRGVTDGPKVNLETGEYITLRGSDELLVTLTCSAKLKVLPKMES